MVRKVHCFIATQINESTKSISHVGNELASSYPRKYNTFNSLFGFYVKITGSEISVMYFMLERYLKNITWRAT